MAIKQNFCTWLLFFWADNTVFLMLLWDDDGRDTCSVDMLLSKIPKGSKEQLCVLSLLDLLSLIYLFSWRASVFL